VGYVVDKMTLEQAFSEYFTSPFPLPLLIPSTVPYLLIILSPTLYRLDTNSVRRKWRVITVYREAQVATYVLPTHVPNKKSSGIK
jgi:hypothetical protein